LKTQKIIESSSNHHKHYFWNNFRESYLNLAKIDKMASEKQVDAKYHQEVFKAFKTKLSED